MTGCTVNHDTKIYLTLQLIYITCFIVSSCLVSQRSLVSFMIGVFTQLLFSETLHNIPIPFILTSALISFSVHKNRLDTLYHPVSQLQRQSFLGSQRLCRENLRKFSAKSAPLKTAITNLLSKQTYHKTKVHSEWRYLIYQ